MLAGKQLKITFLPSLTASSTGSCLPEALPRASAKPVHPERESQLLSPLHLFGPDSFPTWLLVTICSDDVSFPTFHWSLRFPDCTAHPLPTPSPPRHIPPGHEGLNPAEAAENSPRRRMGDASTKCSHCEACQAHHARWASCGWLPRPRPTRSGAARPRAASREQLLPRLPLACRESEAQGWSRTDRPGLGQGPKPTSCRSGGCGSPLPAL